jgi:selenocysteine-specific elongation factor
MSLTPLTLGTAGHIDHGKTALIRALTGVDTDRLPEERARGISIELGYAKLDLPSGRRLSVVDVPGHERFVRTMVAGATGIDLYLMTIAADDGVMPQTREHAAVLDALGVTAGVVAVTKSDLADPGPATVQASKLLPGTTALAVSARTGAGLDQLRAALDATARSVPSRSGEPGSARLHVDRVFTIRGAGTVVTGTLWSGVIAGGDVLALLPAGRRVRVRGVQVHDEQRDRAAAGQRVAVNLTGVAVADVARGDVLASTGSELQPTYVIDARLQFHGDEPRHRERVQIHHGTRAVPARSSRLADRVWQLRLEQPLIACAGDRLVVRRIAPPDTLGGGVVLDPHPHGPSRELTVAPAPPTPPDRPPPPPALSPSALALDRRLRAAGTEPPADRELDQGDLAALRAAGRAVRVGRSLHFHAEALGAIRERALALAARHGGQITLAQLRDELGTSRRFAQALLEHLDSERVTIRRGDVHIVRGGRRASVTAP